MPSKIEVIRARIQESIETKQRVLNNYDLVERIGEAASVLSDCIQNGGKVLLCGNGGSASDALHITGELISRFQKERNAMAAVCLNADVTSLTAVANDYGYDHVFERVVGGLMKQQDVLIGISTSGNSENIYLAMLKATEIGGKCIAFLGRDGGKIRDIVDIPIVVSVDNTARIQESHIMIGHILCELIEEEIFKGQ